MYNGPTVFYPFHLWRVFLLFENSRPATAAVIIKTFFLMVSRGVGFIGFYSDIYIVVIMVKWFLESSNCVRS